MDIFYEIQDLAGAAEKLADHYGFQYRGNIHHHDIQLNQEVLNLTPQGLMVISADAKPWQIDFLNAARQYRRKHGGSETLVRACGIKKNHEPLTIIDATAGYGKDGFVLACAGAKVILVERHPVMAALLENALKRFYESPIDSKNIDIQLCFSEAETFLKHHLNDFSSTLPDVIYWDPMHPVRQKSAQVKKDMAFLQRWIEPEIDPESLIALSLPYVKDRVVLKWPRKATPLKLKSNFLYEEKTVRFEIFKSFKDAVLNP